MSLDVDVRDTRGHLVYLRINDDVQFCFSYGTIVAAFVPGRGVLVVDKFYSRTTSSHISQFRSYHYRCDTVKVLESDIANMVARIVLEPDQVTKLLLTDQKCRQCRHRKD